MATRKTPETLTAVDRARAMARNSQPLPPLSLSPRPQMTSRTETRNAAVADQARANLGQAGRPTRTMAMTPSLDPRADADDSFSILPIGEIDLYEHNPRTGPNPRYDDIRASIMADGITNPLTVTRRPESSRYHPYGGGNTRLAIAKELQANGDARFDTLRVVVKVWPGHANVISAHLAENEMRGDISFWEKAQGVASFKTAHETEHDVVLSTGDLGRELKAHGINFGVRVIQNFSFAVEHLSPVGPWLKAKEVNEIIRPGMAGAMAVATKFDLGWAFGQQVLLKHRDQVLAVITYNKTAEENQRKPVEIDAAELVADLHEALAIALGVSPEVMPLMISAVESNSRISAQELKAIQIRTAPEPSNSAPATPANSTAGTTAAPTGPGPLQRPLGGMLAGVPSSGISTPGPVSPARRPSAPVVTPTGAEAPGQQGTAGRIANVSEDDPTAHILNLVLDISDLASLQDCILHVKGMPFGYCMDMPEALDKLGDQTLTEGQAQVRGAAWKFLAALSCQLDPQWFTFVDEELSNWSRNAKAGPDVFRQSYQRSLRGITASTGEPAMLLGEVYAMFSHPELAYLTVQLLRAMEQLRLGHPERMLRTVTPDPDFPD